jgi:environmental stress-induced protein Ves
MRAVTAAARPSVPWANGGGTTRELAVGAAAAGADGPSFDWRLSLADVGREGPFSALFGVDRVLAVTEGTLALAFAPVDPAATGAHRVAPSRRDAVEVRRALDADAPPLRFPGEAAPQAVPGAGGCRVLNLMLARGRCDGAIRRVALADGAALDPRWVLAHAKAPGYLHACWVARGALAVGAAQAAAGSLALLDPDDPAARARGETLLLEVVVVAQGGVRAGAGGGAGRGEIGDGR